MQPAPVAKPPLIVWDVVLSAAALVVGTLLVALGALGGLFLVVFLDNCPPARCSPAGAFAAVSIGVVAAAGVGIAGLVITVVRIGRRRIAWPFAVGALLLAVLALAGGAAGFVGAVGG